MGPRIRSSAELEQLKDAFNFKQFEFVAAKAEYDASITDESSEDEDAVSSMSESQEDLNTIQPNGMHKPQFIAPAQVDDDEVQGEDLSEIESEESDDDLDFDVQSVESDNAQFLEGSESSFSRQITCDSDAVGSNLYAELASSKKCETLSAYDISTGSPMMMT